MKSAHTLENGTAVDRNFSVICPAEHRTEGKTTRFLKIGENAILKRLSVVDVF